MHAEAYAAAIRMVAESRIDASRLHTGLDLGGVNVNGTIRGLFPATTWTGLDISPGPEVDVVADATTWRSDNKFDIVISTELFEHCIGWPKAVETMAYHLNPEGPQTVFITAGSTGRRPHGKRGNWNPDTGEHYENVEPEDLRSVLSEYFEEVHVTYNAKACDVYAWATKLRMNTDG
jgi:hypothetical protein